MAKRYKVVVFTPETHSEQLRQTLGDAGAGKIGNYSHCSFTIKGVGRFTPMEGANPTIGEVGRPEEVNEDRIEVVCEEEKLDDILQAIKEAHPYEEPSIDVYPTAVIS